MSLTLACGCVHAKEPRMQSILAQSPAASMPSLVLSQLILRAKDDMSLRVSAYRRRLHDLILEKMWGDCAERDDNVPMNELWTKLLALHRAMMFDVT
jgi:hypothetical protein